MNQYENECIYIAGPECFYTGGFDTLNAMRRRAETLGFAVSLPNDDPLKLDHEDLRQNADTIFANCADSMNRSTAIIADLETFRGTEPDGGTIYEAGMAHALGLRCYAYTRDKRDMVHKYTGAALRDGLVYDLDGRVLPYQDLPFSPCVVGACKIVEGDFYRCLDVMAVDIDEERKRGVAPPVPAARRPDGGKLPPALAKKDKPVLYLSGPQRYDNDAAEQYAAMKQLCGRHGFAAVSPLDLAAGAPAANAADPYEKAYQIFQNWRRHVLDCDVLLADLNDFHGMEPNSDVSFEAGMAWQLGKPCFGYMKNTANTRARIPHYGDDRNNKDICGNDVENFDYPINLMFASSMPVYEGDFETVLARVEKEVFG